MILLTDGNANVGCDGCTDYNESAGRTFAVAMAKKAGENGIQLFTVSVGADSDTSVMDEIAGIDGGSHFHAEGSIDEYSQQLDAIFEALGGKRPVELIR
jgi:Mg-chelatase subunit ChlD